MQRATLRSIPLPLSVLVPGSVAGLFHRTMVTDDILLQETACPVCVETRAIAGQVGISVGLAAVSAFAGTVVVAHYLNLNWIPRTIWGYRHVIKNLAEKSSMLFVTLIVAEMLAAGGLVYFEQKSFDLVMEELERRVEEDKRGVDSRLLTLDREGY